METRHVVLHTITKYFFGTQYPDAKEMAVILERNGIDIEETWRELQKVLTKAVTGGRK